jgi:hypothetical protein
VCCGRPRCRKEVSHAAREHTSTQTTLCVSSAPSDLLELPHSRLSVGAVTIGAGWNNEATFKKLCCDRRAVSSIVCISTSKRPRSAGIRRGVNEVLCDHPPIQRLLLQFCERRNDRCIGLNARCQNSISSVPSPHVNLCRRCLLVRD